MANPRHTYELDELFVKRVTMAADSSLPFSRTAPYGTTSRFAPVKITGNKTVGLCADGDVPFGALERIEADGSAVVAWMGSVTYAGSATAGDPVVANGSGGVRAAVAGTDEGKGVAGTSENGRVVVFQ